MIITIQLDDDNPDDRPVLDRVVKAIDRLRAKEEADAFDGLAQQFVIDPDGKPFFLGSSRPTSDPAN